ncbi:hypothetical protein PF005_g12055 [Phytophthora fragariae]|uniref:RxLR effector protein n=1 Tax=Phytophthora fragariae TaxID=53985 RepID=A0A6A3TY00_9STRA|nr:hypothetical protein PF003_g7074 [Phytophthora fragariae]KAE8937196.1 hypothetical protein PF009_g12898 [Phytophthora fragariae]KAE9008317.1 hypothetical protein PF011_g10756 [Phytophthora fragariae]KAE9109323.1 hypothetical protein PF010_g11586 [Phytophthora fragariae]KAE9111155.1 hypothetical protein PF007_g11586 [Phytophthora fragariae]
MQLLKGLFVAAVLCMATVSAGNHQQQQEEQEQNNGKQYGVKSDSRSSSKGDSNDDTVQQGFNVHHVNFAASDPNEEKGEEKESSSSAVPLIAAVGACACIGVLGTVYLKRRQEDDKLPGEIFTIDDKNSVL